MKSFLGDIKGVTNENTVRDGLSKRRVGRPKEKKGTYKKVTFELPAELLEKVQVAKTSYEHNLTKYLNTIIENDIEKNFMDYADEYNRQKNKQY